MKARQIIENTDIKDELFDLPDEWLVVRRTRPDEDADWESEYLEVNRDGSLIWMTKPYYGTVLDHERAQHFANRMFQWHRSQDFEFDIQVERTTGSVNPNE